MLMDPYDMFKPTSNTFPCWSFGERRWETDSMAVDLKTARTHKKNKKNFCSWETAAIARQPVMITKKEAHLALVLCARNQLSPVPRICRYRSVLVKEGAKVILRQAEMSSWTILSTSTVVKKKTSSLGFIACGKTVLLGDSETRALSIQRILCGGLTAKAMQCVACEHMKKCTVNSFLPDNARKCCLQDGCGALKPNDFNCIFFSGIKERSWPIA